MGAEGGVDPDELGRATWTFLHTLAATHPAEPTQKEVTRIQRFISDFSHIYPCAPCADSFRNIIKRRPVDATSGPRFAQWMCDAHNEVNKEIGKPKFDCANVTERWGACETCARHSDKLDAFKIAITEFSTVEKKSS